MKIPPEVVKAVAKFIHPILIVMNEPANSKLAAWNIKINGYKFVVSATKDEIRIFFQKVEGV